MQAILIELILWAALLFFFWALKDNLGRIESDLETTGSGRTARRSARVTPRGNFRQAQRLIEPIGSFQGERIYRYAVFEGRTYRFDHVWTGDQPPALRDNQRWMAPGIVYKACEHN